MPLAMFDLIDEIMESIAVQNQWLEQIVQC